MKITIVDRIKNQRHICDEILRNSWSYRTDLSTMQLAFVYKMNLLFIPCDDVQLGVLRSFLKRTGKK